MKHVLILSNAARTLVRFRGHLIRNLVGRGHRVTAAAAESDQSVERTLSEWDVSYRPVQLGRTGMNPFADMGALAALVSLMKRERPDIFFGYTIKPIVYGLLAARLAGVPRRIVMVTGLGYAFTEGAGIKRQLARRIARAAYRLSLRFADCVIFQNPDDRAYFLENGLVAGAERTALVSGSGVDLAHYAPAALPHGPVTFLMIARLLADKGVREFVEAARILKPAHPEARFVIVGRRDTNPAAVQPIEIEAWVREGIEYRGALADVRPAIGGCHVYVLPSYREGMPRTVLEAAAMGRAIVTTDVPGCRETVMEGKNGLLVPARDAEALAGAMRQFARDPDFVATAGAASLALARERFDVEIVNAAMMKVIEGG